MDVNIMSPRQTTFWTLLLATACLFASAARAELILDEFDVSASTTSPAMRNERVVSPEVGEVNAQRSIRIAFTVYRPDAFLNVANESSSQLRANLSTLNPIRRVDSVFAFQFSYSFLPADISQGGINNAIVLDFASSAGTGYRPELGLIIVDDTDLTESYFSAVPHLPLSATPFSVSLPFASFTQRGGAPGLPDFTNVKEMRFDFFFLYPPVDTQWTAAVERVRIASIPEPCSLLLAASLTIPQRLTRCRRRLACRN